MIPWRSTALVLVLWALHGAASPLLHGKVVHVSDGDTVDVLLQGARARVNLAGIDAPEPDQPGGAQARRALGELVFDAFVRVVRIEGEANTQIAGRLYLGGFDSGTDVNAAMVRQGHAWAAPGADAELMGLEREAREAGRGLWASDVQVPPWRWREGQRAGQR